MDTSQKYPALIVGAPYGGVKEQGAGIYAQNIAERQDTYHLRTSCPRIPEEWEASRLGM